MYSAFGVDHGDIEKGFGSSIKGAARGLFGGGGKRIAGRGPSSSPIGDQLQAGGKAKKLDIPKGGSIYDQMVAQRGAPGVAKPKKQGGSLKPMVAGGKARVAGAFAAGKSRFASTGGAHRGHRTYGIKPAGGKHRA